jgi:N-acetyl-anhydromuramyl-L-alanine amidase AmpD
VKRWHVTAGGLALVVALVALALSVFTAGGGHLRVVWGQPLKPAGQQVYKTVTAQRLEQGQRTGSETLPPAQVARLNRANQAAALKGTVGPNHPVPLATPEPITQTRLVRNYSSRNGHRPAILVVHDTESPNAAGLQDVLAIAAWFNNPVSQASSNYTTDADGNTLLLVPDTAKAWTQAYFNSWSISDELIGYASQTSWPDAQLRAVAQLFAAEAAKWGIPVQRGLISGCTILRPGIVEHRDLGQCGGGHHDAGLDFPLTRFIALVKEYRAGGYHPKTAPKTKTSSSTARHVASHPIVSGSCGRANILRALRTHGGVHGSIADSVKRFQRIHRLAVDGIVGPRTGAALGLRGC